MRKRRKKSNHTIEKLKKKTNKRRRERHLNSKRLLRIAPISFEGLNDFCKYGYLQYFQRFIFPRNP